MGTTRFSDHRTIRLMKLSASAMLSAAIKRQHSSLLPLIKTIRIRYCLPVFDDMRSQDRALNGNEFSIFRPGNTN